MTTPIIIIPMLVSIITVVVVMIRTVALASMVVSTVIVMPIPKGTSSMTVSRVVGVGGTVAAGMTRSGSVKSIATAGSGHEPPFVSGYVVTTIGPTSGIRTCSATPSKSRTIAI